MDLPSKVVLVPMKYFLFSILSFFLLSNIVFGQSSQYESVGQCVLQIMDEKKLSGNKMFDLVKDECERLMKSKRRIKVDETEGMFVTVGHSGTILTSSDGTSWTERTSGTSMSLRGVTYGNGLFVTVDDRGTILTSSNGISWTKRTSGTSEYLQGVTYGNGLFVSVGDNGILTSSDGTTWTQQRYTGTSKILYYVTYGNDLFVSVGYPSIILTSSNGTSWTQQRTTQT